MKAKENFKFQNAKTLTIKRSKINFAAYNPRTISDKALKALKANIKKVGLLGGLVLNTKTMNIVSGHQRITALDQLHKYDPKTKKNDYDLVVEAVEMTQIEEKEQNIFMNSTTVQGEFDYEKLGALLPDIDYKAAGLDDFDVNMIIAESPQIDAGNTTEIQEDLTELEKPYEERKEAIKEAKKAQNEAADEKYEGDPFFSVAFDNYENKVEFMAQMGFDSDVKFVKGEELLEKILNL